MMACVGGKAQGKGILPCLPLQFAAAARKLRLPGHAVAVLAMARLFLIAVCCARGGIGLETRREAVKMAMMLHAAAALRPHSITGRNQGQMLLSGGGFVKWKAKW